MTEEFAAEMFSRSELVLGKEGLERLGKARIIIFGAGGVGSWCAEALVRTGVMNLSIVDFDRICVSNINRQAEADSENVGQPKAFEMKKRLKRINPHANIEAFDVRFTPENSGEFSLESYDYVADAIDSVGDKVFLLKTCLEKGIPVISSMGAGSKSGTSGIEISLISKTQNCPLARAVRQSLRKSGTAADIACVYSTALPEKKRSIAAGEKTGETGVNGSLVYVTGIFGFMMAGKIIRDITRQT